MVAVIMALFLCYATKHEKPSGNITSVKFPSCFIRRKHDQRRLDDVESNCREGCNDKAWANCSNDSNLCIRSSNILP